MCIAGYKYCNEYIDWVIKKYTSNLSHRLLTKKRKLSCSISNYENTNYDFQEVKDFWNNFQSLDLSLAFVLKTKLTASKKKHNLDHVSKINKEQICV